MYKRAELVKIAESYGINFQELYNPDLSCEKIRLLIGIKNTFLPDEIFNKIKGTELKPEVCKFLSHIVEFSEDDFWGIIEYINEPLYTLMVLYYAYKRGIDLNKNYRPNMDCRQLKVLVDFNGEKTFTENYTWFDMYREFYLADWCPPKPDGNKVYEFTGEIKEYQGRILKRIRYIDGDKHKGGWIEKESNLEHSAYCRLYEEAMIYDNARVEGSCNIRGYAQIYGNARIIGDEIINIQCFAQIYDNAQIIGGAVIEGDAKVHGNVQVLGPCVTIDCEAEVYGDAIIYDGAIITEQAHVRDNATVGDRAHVGGKSLVHGNAQIILFQHVYADMQVDGGFYSEHGLWDIDYRLASAYVGGAYLISHPKDILIPNYIQEYIPKLYKRLGLHQDKEVNIFSYELGIQEYKEYSRGYAEEPINEDNIIYIPSDELPPTNKIVSHKKSISKLDIKF